VTVAREDPDHVTEMEREVERRRGRRSGNRKRRKRRRVFMRKRERRKDCPQSNLDTYLFVLPPSGLDTYLDWYSQKIYQIVLVHMARSIQLI